MADAAIAPADVPVIPRGVRLHFDRVRDRWVLLAPERTVNLDSIGLAILREIDGKSSLGHIAETLAETYAAPVPQVTADTVEFVAGLMERRMLEIRS